MSGPPRDGLGLGLRRPLIDALLARPSAVDFVELIAESHLEPGALPRTRAEAVAARIPTVGHGVGLNLLGAEPLDPAHLHALRGLVRGCHLAWFSDHLCWSAAGARRHHDLLPAPLRPDLIPYAAARARAVQDALGVPFGLENVSSYVAWEGDTVPEWEFLAAVAEAADCGLIVDVNNIFVSARNHGFDPLDHLRAVPWGRVLEVHIAGHRARPDGLLHDTHDAPVAPEVWALYAEAWALGGPFPTLLEWDDQIPPLDTLCAVLATARAVRA